MRAREGGDHVQVHVNLPSRQDAPQRGGRAHSKSSQVKSVQVQVQVMSSIDLT